MYNTTETRQEIDRLPASCNKGLPAPCGRGGVKTAEWRPGWHKANVNTVPGSSSSRRGTWSCVRRTLTTQWQLGCSLLLSFIPPPPPPPPRHIVLNLTSSDQTKMSPPEQEGRYSLSLPTADRSSSYLRGGGGGHTHREAVKRQRLAAACVRRCRFSSSAPSRRKHRAALPGFPLE